MSKIIQMKLHTKCTFLRNAVKTVEQPINIKVHDVKFALVQWSFIAMQTK